MNDEAEEKLLDSKEVAARLDERVGLISNWARRGTIEARKVGNRWMVPISEVKRIEAERYRLYREDRSKRART